MATIPRFRLVDLERVVHMGMRDVTELERGRVMASKMAVVWGGDGERLDFVAGLRELGRRIAGVAIGAVKMVVEDLSRKGLLVSNET